VDFKRYDTIIDCRSPSEYAHDHVPGAISAPVLDDAERATVGTMYKQLCAFEAKKLGASLVAKNIARHVQTLFADKQRGWLPLAYCWRGGKRSGAMAHILREVGWEAHTLEGGYRRYRQWVVAQLESVPEKLEFNVIQGPTGSGKSRLLSALRQAGAQVLDLEELAAHRGSVLGNLPDRPQPSQKWFESQLLAALGALDAARPVFVEGESKKIGQLQVPEALIARMRASRCLRIEAALEVRVTLLLDEYRHFLADPGSLQAQLDCLAGLHGREKIAGWKALAARGAWRELVARLLAEHYDPAYGRSSLKNFTRLPEAQTVRIESADGNAFAGAAERILDELVSA